MEDEGPRATSVSLPTRILAEAGEGFGARLWVKNQPEMLPVILTGPDH